LFSEILPEKCLKLLSGTTKKEGLLVLKRAPAVKIVTRCRKSRIAIRSSRQSRQCPTLTTTLYKHTWMYVVNRVLRKFCGYSCPRITSGGDQIFSNRCQRLSANLFLY
jgi:hypothetical protein